MSEQGRKIHNPRNRVKVPGQTGRSNWGEQAWLGLGTGRRILLEQLIADGMTNSQIMKATGAPYGAVHKIRNRDDENVICRD